MKLFDSKIHTDVRPSDDSKPWIHRLSRRDIPDVLRIRELLEEWYTKFPLDETTRKSFLGDFGSKKDLQHLGALFELYLHELFFSSGFTLERLERPDFKVFRDNEPLFFLEATIASSHQENIERKQGINRGCHELTPHLKIKKAVREKAGKYGKLDLPYIIAINVLESFGLDDIDIRNGLLWGDGTQYIIRDDLAIEEKPALFPARTLYGPKGEQNTRVSAVLIVANLFPNSIARETPVLWHNPWAKKPLDKNIFPFPQWVPENDTLVKHDGKEARELFSLPENWPAK